MAQPLWLRIEGARQNNLKNVTLAIPHARHPVGRDGERLDRPDVDRIEHIRPAIALEQKNPVRTARSTAGEATHAPDELRLLSAQGGRNAARSGRCSSA